MNVLHPGQSLRAGDELTSNNDWFSATVLDNGTFGVFRALGALELWNSRSPLPAPGACRLVMQADGNLVALSVAGVPYWASGTSGHPNAALRIQDDGDLQVLDPRGRRLWHTGTAQDLVSPTVRYTTPDGWRVNETSESWKELCSRLPCCLALQWPGYSTTIVEDVIGGVPIVIQLWKGWCPKFLGLNAFPGGIGAEVGIYRRMPGRPRPAAFPFLPQPLASKVLDALATVADENLWWPFPELATRLTFRLVHPRTGFELLSAGPETSYWLAKWMEDASYREFARHLGAPPPSFFPWYPDNEAVPSSPDEYTLHYSINGRDYPAWVRSSFMPDLSGVTSLLLG